MGTVYRATHLLIDRPVAIKVLSQRFVGDETAQHRFRREARAAGRMQHPNAVTVNDFGTTQDGWLYIVMELLEGRTLREVLALEGRLDSARAVSFMLQACSAVGAAHDAKLIHRDLKWTMTARDLSYSMDECSNSHFQPMRFFRGDRQ